VKPNISVVSPLRNEEKNIPELVRRLVKTLEGMGLSYELILVTDENTDRTVEVLREQHAANPCVKMVKLARGRGQQMAVVAGLDASRGEAVVIMDGDLQDYPEDIPKLYERLQEGFDIVYGVKEKTNPSAIRNLLSSLFTRVMNYLSDSNLSFNTALFRILSRRMVTQLIRFREYDQALPQLMTFIGLPEASVPVTSGQRMAGETNYGFRRQLNMAVTCLLQFSTKPLRMISMLGFICAGLSIVHVLFVLWRWRIGVSVAGWPTLAVLVSFLGSIQLISLGVIGEYISSVVMEGKRRPLYVREETLGDVLDDES